jgi:hypothetical protein
VAVAVISPERLSDMGEGYGARMRLCGPFTCAVPEPCGQPWPGAVWHGIALTHAALVYQPSVGMLRIRQRR